MSKLIEGNQYLLLNAAARTAMEALPGTTAVVGYTINTSTGSDHQVWKVQLKQRDSKASWYSLINVVSGKALNVPKTATGTPLEVSAATGDESQQFRFVEVPDRKFPFYVIYSRSAQSEGFDRVIDLTRGSPNDGTIITIWDAYGSAPGSNPNQVWMLVNVEGDT